MTLPGLSCGDFSASLHLPDVPAAGSVVVLLVVPGVISVLSAPTSLTQNCNTRAHTHQWVGYTCLFNTYQKHIKASFDLKVAAGQDGHPFLPLENMDDATSPAHLCCQSGCDRLIDPASFAGVAHRDSWSHLHFLMAGSRRYGETQSS